MSSPTEQAQNNFLSNLDSYFKSTTQIPLDTKSGSSRANSTIGTRKQKYGSSTVSASAEAKLKDK